MNDTTDVHEPAIANSLDLSLEELLREQVEDWMKGTPHPLKVYLDRQPAMRGQSAVLVELINQEVVLRQMQGETPRPEDYLVEFPELSDSLIRLFEVHAAASLPTVLREGEDLADSPIESDSERDNIARVPRIPGYDIDRVLGRGGMGVVYLARHRALNRKVALKLLQEGRQDDPAHRARFEREAAAVARCQHPHLVQIHEIGEHDGQFYLALEYVEGGTLARALAGVPQPPRFAAALVETLARAIDHAHAQGVVHRDLKPANVLLTSDGQPKITDFGLAKLKDISAQTEERTLLGTLAYMSPEQVRGESEAIGPGVDIHALGSILYEALTGRPPYRAATPPQIIHAILCEEVIAPSARLPGIPLDLEAICLKCLEKAPKDRYATAADLAEDLRRFLDGRITAARPASRAERCVRWCRRNPWIAASLAILLLGTTTSVWQAVRATFAERTARLAERAALTERHRAESEAASAQRERDRAESEAETAQTVNDFLREILGQATATNQARIDRKPDPNLKIRVALDYAAETIGERFGRRPLVEAATRLTIGEDYLDLGLLAQSRPHLVRAMELRRDLLGENDPQTLAAKCRLGMLLMLESKLKDAEPLLVSAMEGLLNTKGTADPETLIAMRVVGALYINQHKLAEGRQLLRRAVDGFRTVRGPEHPETLNATTELAVALLNFGERIEAERLLEEAISQAAKKAGPEHPATLTAKFNLAFVEGQLGNPLKAIRLFEEVWQVQEHVRGHGHPETLSTIAMLGYNYVHQNQHDKAEPLLLDALAECRKSLDRNHLATDLVLASLAAMYSMKKDLHKTGQYLIEAVEITRLQFGPDAEVTDAGTRNVVRLYLILNDLSKAEPFIRDHLAFCLRHKPDDSSRYVAEGELGLCLLARKAYSEAEHGLLLGHQWIASHPESSPAEALVQFKGIEDRVIKLYEEVGNREQAGAWRMRRSDLDFPQDPFVP